MKLDPSKMYDQEFYRMHVAWEQEYIGIANSLSCVLTHETVLDLGCGNGYIINQLLELGKEVRGVEASLSAFAAMPARLRGLVVQRDLAQPLFIGQADLVICTEVAEHLLACQADTLVDTICAHALKYVFFTAAVPGQGGRYHFNEQPQEYWRLKFQERYYTYSDDLTERLRIEFKTYVREVQWLQRNAMVYLAPTVKESVT